MLTTMNGASEMAIDLEKQTKDIYAALNAHDLERFLSFHTDDVTSENVATGVVVRGKEDLRTSFEIAFSEIPDVRMELTSCFASGNCQCEEYVLSGTHKGKGELMGMPAPGKTFSVRGILVREIREGKTCRVTQYVDSATLMRQLNDPPSNLQKEIA
jgi:steroid delta-isomerase-like uncharacterized protein